MTIEDGLDFILSHFNDPSSPYPHFPRRISTKISNNAQFLVDSKDEALEKFNTSSLIDCRINAYPLVESHPPNLIFVDIDKKKGVGSKTLDKYLNTTLELMKKYNCTPTVLFTGGGYHIYQPINCNFNDLMSGYVDTLYNYLSLISLDKSISDIFLKFCEQFFSNEKADINHNPTIRSCLLRIPESINSKNKKKVEIVQKWDGFRPNMDIFFVDFHIYLKKQNELIKKKENKNNNYEECNIESIYWIDKLISTPISDNRKEVLWKIICPYLKNVKGMTFEECYPIMVNWLNKCDALNPLDFRPDEKIRITYKNTKQYKPIGLKKLAFINKLLYDEIVKIIH